MFCPKCSQQQSAEEARFCSRCGLQLGVVKALLTADNTDDDARGGAAPDPSLRTRDMSVGAALMFFVALVLALIALDMPPSFNSRIYPLVVAWLALMLLVNIRPLMRYFLGTGAPRQAEDAAATAPPPDLTTKVAAASRRSALPPATEGVPASAFGAQRVNTAEVVHPPSVTDHTTNLLRDR